MIITKIVEFIDNLMEADGKDNFDSLLIDGDWGIGKTFTVTKHINDKKYNYFYISLFGIDSLNSLMARLCEKIDTKYIVLTNGNMFFSDSYDQKPKNDSVIIFDDLERKATTVSFDLISGVINSLKKLGFKIICLANSKYIDDKSKDAFIDLKEKCFYMTVPVEVDYTKLNEVIDNEEIEPSETILVNADNNWRIVIRANNLYKEVKDYMIDKGYADFLDRLKLNNSTFFRCAVLATNCVYLQSKEKPTFDNKSSQYAEFEYEERANEYIMEGVANKFYKLFSEQKENKMLKNGVDLLINYLIKKDYNTIINACYISNNINDIVFSTPFDKGLFYYGDEDKMKYKNEFFDRINEFDFSKNAHLQIAINIIKYMFDSISEEEKNIILHKLVANKNKDELERLQDNIKLSFSNDDLDGQTFKNKILEEISSTIKKQENNKLEEAIEKKDYDYLIDYLYNNNYSDQEKLRSIAEEFENVNYLLPDLSQTIDERVWTYCHEIARFISRVSSCKDNFINYLLTLYDKSKSNTLRTRCLALVRANFDIETYYKFII